MKKSRKTLLIASLIASLTLSGCSVNNNQKNDFIEK